MRIVPASRQPEQSVELGATAGLRVSRTSSQRPSVAAVADDAISAAAIPRRRAERSTMTLAISARCGEFGFQDADQQDESDHPLPIERDERADRSTSATAGTGSRHQPAAVGRSTPARKFTAKPPPSTASTSDAADTWDDGLVLSGRQDSDPDRLPVDHQPLDRDGSAQIAARRSAYSGIRIIGGRLRGRPVR